MTHSDDGLDIERVRTIAGLLIGLTGERLVSPELRADVEEVARTALARTRNRRQWHDDAMPKSMPPTVFRMAVLRNFVGL